MIMPELQQPVSGMSEKMRLIRFRMNRETFRFSDEIRLIPRWLVYLVIVLFIVAQAIAQLLNHFEPFTGVPPKWAALAVFGIVTAAGVPIACVLLLFGYINRDAKRRGMHSALWTLLAILVPYLIGVIIYFLLREPLPFSCPQCGAVVGARLNYCSACGYSLHPTCPQCKHEVREGDHFCPHCAHRLAGAAS
jgi:hypothetical protein